MMLPYMSMRTSLTDPDVATTPAHDENRVAGRKPTGMRPVRLVVPDAVENCAS